VCRVGKKPAARKGGGVFPGDQEDKISPRREKEGVLAKADLIGRV